MAIFTNLFTLIKEHRKAYFWLNATFYGFVVLGMMLMANNPSLEHMLRNSIKSNFNQALLSAYAQGQVVPAILLTFTNNFVLASILAITMPSLVIPFWGLAICAFRAFIWGLALSPADPAYHATFISQIPTFLIEGQGYVLAMFAVYQLWHNTFWPRLAGTEGVLKGYKLGLRQTAILYIGVFILLVLGAIYEPLAAIYLVPILH